MVFCEAPLLFPKVGLKQRFFFHDIHHLSCFRLPQQGRDPPQKNGKQLIFYHGAQENTGQDDQTAKPIFPWVVAQRGKQLPADPSRHLPALAPQQEKQWQGNERTQSKQAEGQQNAALGRHRQTCHRVAEKETSHSENQRYHPTAQSCGAQQPYQKGPAPPRPTGFPKN